MNPSSLRQESICAILPAFNEGDNLLQVVDELALELRGLFASWEIVVVDDGSTDDTRQVLDELSQRHERLRYLRQSPNRGKSDALRLGFEQTSSDLVMLMDADGQDDPGSLPAMLAELDSGQDLATGRRADRHDRFAKRTTSKVFNWTTARITRVPGSDFNSGFKLMRRDVTEQLNLYGELHRYIPVLTAWSGFRVGEVDVAHRDRLHGDSKYGRSRFWRGMLDLFTVKFLITYDRRPFHLIGGTGLIVFAIGLALIFWMFLEWITGTTVGNRPALLAGVTFTVLGVQLVCVGLIAELIVHFHYERLRDPD